MKQNIDIHVLEYEIKLDPIDLVLLYNTKKKINLNMSTLIYSL